MNKSNPSELARETLKTLAARKMPPTPDNYSRIYAEISGIPADGDRSATKVLRGIAEHLAQTPQSAPAGMALKKVIGTEDWDQCLKEIEKVLPKPGGESTLSWSDLIRDLLRQLETPHKGLTVTRKKEGLETVLRRFTANPEALHDKLNGLIRSWAVSPVASSTEIDSVTPAASGSVTAVPASAAAHHIPGEEAGMPARLAELLAQTLQGILGALPELTQEVQALVQQVRDIKAPEQLTAFAKQLRQFLIKAELRAGDNAKVHEGLVRLLRLLVENVGEMVEDEDWLHGQVAILQEIIARPIDRHAIADAERGLRDAIIKQGMLKQSLSEAKTTLKSLMATFIDRLGEITESTGDYHQKIEGYSKKIGKSNNLTELSHLLEDIMQDTRVIQASALRSHEELVGTRKQVQEAEAKIRKLELELAQVSELVHQDQLTGALNRHGLDEAFEREATRADRSHTPVCIALLDIDNFKRLNDTMGHQAGDQALVHLSQVIKEALRPSDAVARYGGEEFIIVLPGIGLEEATATVERLQRELTKKFFLHENDRVLITFSAGVALRSPQEPQEDVIGRADRAMYKAKHTGKNRVIVAE
ncbi:MAG: diguanylate cyclase [Betaproteobacteria bacterium RIFCSPLOWO2_12_61_14]|nr:MAG: diguanylate cyclase [Betaproteobacteria bacterium RIFCSPLOWO2_12_61_14]